VAGGTSSGKRINQLTHPHGVYVDDEQTVYVADYGNHRIMEWKYGATSGRVVADGNGPGNGLDQLNGPTDVTVDKKSNCLIICDRENRRVVQWSRRNNTNAQTIIPDVDCYGLTMDNNGYLYVSDSVKNEVKRWEIGDSFGIVVAGGNGEGNRLDQLNYPTFLFVDEDQTVYVSDTNNHRVMKWMKGAKEGIVVAGRRVQGNDLTQLSQPYGIVVDQLGTVYVVDYGNNRVMRWCHGAAQGTIVIGGNGPGDEPNQLNGPGGLSFDQQGNLYVVDNHNHRVQKFNVRSGSRF